MQFYVLNQLSCFVFPEKTPEAGKAADTKKTLRASTGSLAGVTVDKCLISVIVHFLPSFPLIITNQNSESNTYVVSLKLRHMFF